MNAVASKHSENRKLDPGKFKNVKSKVGRNIKVANKQSVHQMKKKSVELSNNEGTMNSQTV